MNDDAIASMKSFTEVEEETDEEETDNNKKNNKDTESGEKRNEIEWRSLFNGVSTTPTLINTAINNKKRVTNIDQYIRGGLGFQVKRTAQREIRIPKRGAAPGRRGCERRRSASPPSCLRWNDADDIRPRPAWLRL